MLETPCDRQAFMSRLSVPACNANKAYEYYDGLLVISPIWEKVCSYRFTTESLINLLIAYNGTEYVRSSVTGDNKHEGGDSNGAWEKVRLRSHVHVIN